MANELPPREAELLKRVADRDPLTITIQCAGLVRGKASPATITLSMTRALYEEAKVGRDLAHTRIALAVTDALVRLEGAAQSIQV